MLIVAGGLTASVLPQDAHAQGLVPRKPDVAVSVVGHSGDVVNDHLDVAFNLTDKYHDASVQLKSLYASMQAPVPYLVTCVPGTNERVSSVTLVANVVNGDFNTSNNVASWDP